MPYTRSFNMRHDPELKRLLLENKRGGGLDEQISRFDKQQILEQQARLIENGLAKGVAILEAGKLKWVKGFDISSLGHEWLEGLDFRPDSIDFKHMNEPTSPDAKESRKIFVSHSSRDSDLAEALVDLLCAAIHLKRSDFLCTSVEGCRLRGGAQTDEVLRTSIQSSEVFLSILTPDAMASSYVLFELGARWGSGKPHLPLLARGARADMLKEPLKATNALRLSERSQVLDLIEAVADLLSCATDSPAGYISKVDKVLKLAEVPQENAQKQVPSNMDAPSNRYGPVYTDKPPQARQIPGIRKLPSQSSNATKRLSAECEKVLMSFAANPIHSMVPVEIENTVNLPRVICDDCLMQLYKLGYIEYQGRLCKVTTKGHSYLQEHRITNNP
jgi:hypothetical protein